LTGKRKICGCGLTGENRQSKRVQPLAPLALFNQIAVGQIEWVILLICLSEDGLLLPRFENVPFSRRVIA
jgi:hypothetical protein